jgi:hypothetical protein
VFPSFSDRARRSLVTDSHRPIVSFHVCSRVSAHKGRIASRVRRDDGTIADSHRECKSGRVVHVHGADLSHEYKLSIRVIYSALAMLAANRYVRGTAGPDYALPAAPLTVTVTSCV